MAASYVAKSFYPDFHSGFKAEKTSARDQMKALAFGHPNHTELVHHYKET
jgi:hypothetical protein